MVDRLAARARTNPLTAWFGAFLASRRRLQHFARRVLLETVTPAQRGEPVPEAQTRELLRAAREDAPALIERLDAHAQGLSEPEAQRRLEVDGPNEVDHEKPLPWSLHLWMSYRNPFNLLLTVLAVVSYVTEDVRATVVIGSMVVLSTGLRFVQERRSSRAADALKALVGSTATVIRRPTEAEALEVGARWFDLALRHQPPGSARIEVPMRDVVRGDLVALCAGDMIPADCRVLVAKDLFVSQSAMTGESLPVEKFAEPRGGAQGALEQADLVFMGTNVVSGSATAIAVATGNRTYFGTLAGRVTAAARAPTAFQEGVNSVSWLLIRFALVMVPLVLFVNGFTKNDWTQAFLFALSIAVGLTPEMLPMIVTSTLAKGAVLLSRKRVIVKRLDAIQNFGAMDVLCTDKTGTLTQDKIVLARHTDVFGAPSEEVLNFAFLNSHYQTGLKNLLDRAVLDHVELQSELRLADDYRKVDEIPFDFQRRRMSVVVSERDHHHELICKGAVEEMLAVCSHVRSGGRDVPLDASVLEEVRRCTQALNGEGLRVVGVAMKETPPTQQVYSVADECALVLIGFVAFLDPPKESTAPALAALAAHGVRVKVLTGDNELVTQNVCRQVGFEVGGLMLGSDIASLSDAELAAAIDGTNVFAKLAPLDKERLVRALRAKGHVVGFLGDGINDAPALRAADIGISVDGAVDIAKEAADIILLEKSLLVLEEGVVEGRRTFCNMLKYIRMTASSNFGNVFSVLVASAFLPFLPMLPLQLLVQNLLYDVSQVAIPFDRVDDELVRAPLRWNPAEIGRFMLWFGPLSSVFDVATFALMWFVFGARTPETQALFQSGWFVEGLLTQTLIVHMIRTPLVPFIQSRPSPALLAMTLAVMAVGIALVNGPLSASFRFERLPAAYWPWLVAILLGYGALTSVAKRAYRKRHPWQ